MTLEELEKINQEIAQSDNLLTFEQYVEFQMEYNEWLMFLNMTSHNLNK